MTNYSKFHQMTPKNDENTPKKNVKIFHQATIILPKCMNFNNQNYIFYS